MENQPSPACTITSGDLEELESRLSRIEVKIERILNILESQNSAPKKHEINKPTLEDYRNSIETGDTDSIIQIRRELVELHESNEQFQEYDTQAIRYLYDHIQNSLRSGQAVLIVDLLSSVVEEFSDFEEAEQLRLALPVVRMSASLCPQCGKPWRGNGLCNACADRRSEDMDDE